MKNAHLLPKGASPWGDSMSLAIDETSREIEAIRDDVDVRFKGINTTAQALVGQTDLLQSAIDNSQPIVIDNSTVLNLIVGPDPSPVTKATVQIPVPAGYTSVMIQAYGSAFLQALNGDTGTKFPIESCIVVSSNGTESGPSFYSSIPDSATARLFGVYSTYVTFRAGIASDYVNVQLRMRNAGGTAVYDNGANVASLSVLANFYKGEVLLPPA